MQIRKTLKSGTEAAVIVRRGTKNRLKTTCFRGTSLQRAGNFALWNSPEGLFQDETVLEQFLAELNELWIKEDFDTHSLTITHSAIVGWESTDSVDKYEIDDLERFTPNRKSSALRVRPDLTHLFAPQTKELTLVFEFKSEGERVAAIFHSIYPGADIGELIGNVTERERRVFFDWSHPGA